MAYGGTKKGYVRVALDLPEALRDQLDELAKKELMSRSLLVRRILSHYVSGKDTNSQTNNLKEK
jgi:metal-responsive CopG/Arc/MetJ family transcriptional regulator